MIKLLNLFIATNEIEKFASIEAHWSELMPRPQFAPFQIKHVGRGLGAGPQQKKGLKRSFN